MIVRTARFGVLCAVLAMPGCGGERREPVPPEQVPVSVPTAPTQAKPSPSGEPDAAPADAAADASGSIAIAAELRPGDPPCTLVFTAGHIEEHADWFSAASIERIETRAGKSCSAGVFYDFARETKSAPDDLDPEPLAGGTFPKPGRPVAEEAKDSWCRFEDLSFDGYSDLCVVRMTGAYNYSQVCYVFDPATRTFVEQDDLADLIFLTVDATRKRLISSYRAGGPSYFRGEYGWHNGKLETLSSESTTLGERPDGKPLPKGFSSYVIRHERKGAKLVKTFEGPVR